MSQLCPESALYCSEVSSLPEVQCKKVFFKISQNSRENTCVRVYILVKIQTLLKKTQAQVFSYKFCKFSKNTFSYRTSPMVACDCLHLLFLFNLYHLPTNFFLLLLLVFCYFLVRFITSTLHCLINILTTNYQSKSESFTKSAFQKINALRTFEKQ